MSQTQTATANYYTRSRDGERDKRERESRPGIGPVDFPFTVHCYLYQESIKHVLLSFSLLTTLRAAFEALSWTARGNQPDCLFSSCGIPQSGDQKYSFQRRTLTTAHVSTDSINKPFSVSCVFVDEWGSEKKAEPFQGSSGSELCLDNSVMIMVVYLCKQDDWLAALAHIISLWSQDILYTYTQAEALKMAGVHLTFLPPILSPHPQVYSMQRVTLDSQEQFRSRLIMHEPVEILASNSNTNTSGLCWNKGSSIYHRQESPF